MSIPPPSIHTSSESKTKKKSSTQTPSLPLTHTQYQTPIATLTTRRGFGQWDFINSRNCITYHCQSHLLLDILRHPLEAITITHLPNNTAHEYL